MSVMGNIGNVMIGIVIAKVADGITSFITEQVFANRVRQSVFQDPRSPVFYHPERKGCEGGFATNETDAGAEFPPEAEEFGDIISQFFKRVRLYRIHGSSAAFTLRDSYFLLGEQLSSLIDKGIGDMGSAKRLQSYVEHALMNEEDLECATLSLERIMGIY